MNIHTIFSHMFIKRGFLGLLGIAWGFMLGGSVLMTAVTYGLALAGADRAQVTAYQIMVLVLVIIVAWTVMENEYQERNVTSIKGFLRVFLVAFFFGVVMPALFVLGACITWREWVQKRITSVKDLKSHPLNFSKPTPYANKATNRQRRIGLIGFLHDLMVQPFLRFAH